MSEDRQVTYATPLPPFFYATAHSKGLEAQKSCKCTFQSIYKRTARVTLYPQKSGTLAKLAGPAALTGPETGPRTSSGPHRTCPFDKVPWTPLRAGRASPAIPYGTHKPRPFGKLLSTPLRAGRASFAIYYTAEIKASVGESWESWTNLIRRNRIMGATFDSRALGFCRSLATRLLWSYGRVCRKACEGFLNGACGHISKRPQSWNPDFENEGLWSASFWVD